MFKLIPWACALVVSTALATGDSATSTAPAEAISNEATNAATSPALEATTATGTVARSTFTNGVDQHEPIDEINTLSNASEKVYFFTELKDMAGQSISHRWERNGEVMAEVPFEVGGNRWRIYSTKNLDPAWTGEWKVSVVDNSGNTITTNSFTYTDEPSTAEADATSEVPITPEPAATTDTTTP